MLTCCYCNLTLNYAKDRVEHQDVCAFNPRRDRPRRTARPKASHLRIV